MEIIVNVKEMIATLEEVHKIAQLAGIKAQLDDGHLQVVIGVGLPEGRTQLVYVRVTGEIEDSPVVTFLSPCRIIKKGLLRGLTRDQAIDLLKRNEQILFARFAIQTMKGEDIVVASTDHLLKTLDPEELRSAVLCVAKAADDYEKEFGGDRF
jgi:hypothetical protein